MIRSTLHAVLSSVAQIIVMQNVVHYIVYNSLNPVVYSFAQNVSKIENCAVFCKVLHVQTVVDNAALNVHTMLKKSVGNSIRQTAFHSVVQKKGTTLSHVP